MSNQSENYEDAPASEADKKMSLHRLNMEIYPRGKGTDTKALTENPQCIIENDPASDAGAKSYERNRVIKNKVAEICWNLLEEGSYWNSLKKDNAIDLSIEVGRILEKDHSELLSKFLPYTNDKSTEKKAWRKERSRLYDWVCANKRNWPLKNKVDEICRYLLEKADFYDRAYSPADQLCIHVASIIEEEHSELLSVFDPYKKYKRNKCKDWRKPTFFRWVNEHYTEHQEHQEHQKSNL